MIARMDRNKHLPTILDIRCKDLRFMRIRFRDANSSISVCNLVHSLCSNRNEFFAFQNKEEFKGTPNGWDIFNWEKEFFERQGLGPEWKLVRDVNEHWQLCRTYPSQFIVPSSVKSCSTQTQPHGSCFRCSYGSFLAHQLSNLPPSSEAIIAFPPCVGTIRATKQLYLAAANQWCASLYGSFSSANAQFNPHQVGLMQQRSIADEQMVKAIASLNPNGKQMFIIDCRPWVNAYANAARGAGTEKYVKFHNGSLVP